MLGQEKKKHTPGFLSKFKSSVYVFDFHLNASPESNLSNVCKVNALSNIMLLAKKQIMLWRKPGEATLANFVNNFSQNFFLKTLDNSALILNYVYGEESFFSFNTLNCSVQHSIC